MTKRLGRIKIRRSLAMENGRHIFNAFTAIRFLPVWCEVDVFTDTITYSGTSPMFEKLQNGYVIPEYDIEILLCKCLKKHYTVKKRGG